MCANFRSAVFNLFRNAHASEILKKIEPKRKNIFPKTEKCAKKTGDAYIWLIQLQIHCEKFENIENQEEGVWR